MSTPTIYYNSLVQYARSPIWIGLKNNALALDDMVSLNANLYVWPGDKTALPSGYQSIIKDYSIQKQITAEISDLIRVFALHEPNMHDSSVITTGGLYAVNWAYISGAYTFLNAGASASGTFGVLATQAFLCFDGYKNKKLYNPSLPIASRNFTRYVTRGRYEVLPFLYDNSWPISRIRYRYPSTGYNQVINIGISSGISSTSNFAYHKLLYAPSGPANLGTIVLALPASVDQYIITLEDSFAGVYATYTYNVVCEGKNNPIQVAFVNEQGAIDYITFYGANQRTGNFEQGSYRGNVTKGPFTTDSREIGQYRDFNVNSRESIQVNTGWVDEAFGDTIKQLLMSENTWVLREEENQNVWYAVTFDRGSMTYQTSLRDKVINYSLTFKESFDERLLLR